MDLEYALIGSRALYEILMAAWIHAAGNLFGQTLAGIASRSFLFNCPLERVCVTNLVSNIFGDALRKVICA